jgi:tyrosyl-tRNA synthetase
MGGSDQWGNITTGTEIIRRNEPEAEVFAVTTPLLTRADGQKFGKSEEGNIWLDAEMTSPYQFYQFWINADDRDLPKLFRYFSLKSQHEVETLESDYREDPRALKRLLAEEVTTRVHSEEDVKNVVNVSSILFNPSAQKEQIQSLTKKEFDLIMREIPSYELPAGNLTPELSLIDLLAEHTDICQSKGEARRAITSNAIAVNREKRHDLEATASKEDFIHGEFLLLEKGKKNKFLLKLTEG